MILTKIILYFFIDGNSYVGVVAFDSVDMQQDFIKNYNKKPWPKLSKGVETRCIIKPMKVVDKCSKNR